MIDFLDWQGTWFPGAWVSGASCSGWRSFEVCQQLEVSVCRVQEHSLLPVGYSEDVYWEQEYGSPWQGYLFMCPERLKTLSNLPSLPYLLCFLHSRSL